MNARRFAAGLAAAAFLATGIGYALATPPAPPTESTTATSAPPPSATVSPQAREAAVHTVTTAELGATWRPGCPVGPDGLRRVELDYLGDDGATHRGNLVVATEYVDDVIAIFAELRRLNYPIAKMRTVDHYPGAEDELSMRDNNTSAFNCRPLPSGSWSLHAYGRAVDINPLVNPYIDRAGDLQPKTAGRYLDRTLDEPGMLKPGAPAVRAFTDRGWTWGGDWTDPIDYQHFEID